MLTTLETGLSLHGERGAEEIRVLSHHPDLGFIPPAVLHQLSGQNGHPQLEKMCLWTHTQEWCPPYLSFCWEQDPVLLIM